MSNPGRIEKLGGNLQAPYPLYVASGAICLTLLDYETPLWSDLNRDADAIAWIRFHTGCPIVAEPSKAGFALITNTNKMPSLNHFAIGTAESPELSTTLILQLKGFTSGKFIELIGPGIKTPRGINLSGFSDNSFQERFRFKQFPLGVDIIFTYQHKLSAIPRSIQIVS
jgi:alpha-D-ribose 1-methylphosphonate 5-triphosphate synthase subunit PhnH